jgi:hypothetical protein
MTHSDHTILKIAKDAALELYLQIDGASTQCPIMDKILYLYTIKANIVAGIEADYLQNRETLTEVTEPFLVTLKESADDFRNTYNEIILNGSSPALVRRLERAGRMMFSGMDVFNDKLPLLLKSKEELEELPYDAIEGNLSLPSSKGM